MNSDQIRSLDAHETLEYLIEETPELVHWVNVTKLFFHADPVLAQERRRVFIQPDANYRVRWIKMSRNLFNAFLAKQDIVDVDAEDVQSVFAATIEDIEQILLSHSIDPIYLTPRHLRVYKLP